MRIAEILKWRKASKFYFAEIANLRRRTHLQTAAPTRILQTGGSRINFAASASEKLSPTIAVYLGGLPRTPSQLSLRPKAGSVARPTPLKVSFPFIHAARNEQRE
ncbi:hypothetical protein EV018_17055 [Citrobacter freundii]|nr:hypothetical protein EV018_17055 [Citrobacter freundii]